MQYAMDVHQNSTANGAPCSSSNQLQLQLQLQQLQQQQQQDLQLQNVTMGNQQLSLNHANFSQDADFHQDELVLARTMQANGNDTANMTFKTLQDQANSNFNPKKRIASDSCGPDSIFFGQANGNANGNPNGPFALQGFGAGGAAFAGANKRSMLIGDDLDARNRTLQQQFLAQQQQPSNSNQGPLPRPPNNPGAWNNVNMSGDDFAGANAALRLNLASLQPQQQQHNQSFSHSFPQFQGSSIGSNHQANMGMNMNTGMGMNMNMSMNMGAVYPNMNMSLLSSEDSLNGSNANQLWATEMLLRSGGGNGSSGAGASTGPGNAGGQVGASNSGQPGGDGFMQLQLLRQQQARIQQLEQLEEEAVMRRQLQLLRQSGNSTSGNMNMNLNPMNMNTGPGLDSLRFQQLQQPNNAQGMFSSQDIQQQQQQQQNTSWGLMSAQDFGGNSGIVSSMDHMNGLSDVSSLQQNNPNRSIQSRSSVSTSSVHRRASNSSTSSNMARAAPMLGPIAPPVPAPPANSQPNYKLPPIEEGETPHYDERVHVPLGIEEDPNWLSEFQCFVREELLQVFRASQQDVKIRVASKKVYYKQVGFRCKYCAHWKPSTRAIRSSAFPSSIRQLYQSYTMMVRDHFGNCPAIPKPLKERFLDLKRTNTQGASDSMNYWRYSAEKLGMVDSECGIVLNEQTQANAATKPPFGSDANGVDLSQDMPARLLVKPEDLEDKRISCQFLYTLLTQYQFIRLLPSECIGNRKSLRPGVPGLGCRYCSAAGRMGLSRVFPAKKKQVPAQVQDLYEHIRRCNLCPASVKEELQSLKQERDEKRSASEPPKQSGKDKDKPKQGIVDEDDKGFTDLLWQRLGHRGELASCL